MAIKRKISEERKQQLRDQLERARAKRKPAEYKNVHSTVLDLPDDHNYSFKTVKGWIKESKEQVAAFNKIARSFRSTPQDKQKASNLADSKKAYIGTVNITSRQVIGSVHCLDQMRNIQWFLSVLLWHITQMVHPNVL